MGFLDSFNDIELWRSEEMQLVQVGLLLLVWLLLLLLVLVLALPV